MATCLGHRARTPKYPNGTGCYHRSRSTQMRDNWTKWQLCFGCARKLHPQFYKNTKNHGVRKARTMEQNYTDTPFSIAEMPTS